MYVKMKRRRPVKYDLTGQRFGKLKVLEITRCPKTKRIAWKCLCKCGTTKVILSQSLRNGLTKSCGCGISESRRKSRKFIAKGRRFGKLKVLDYAGDNKFGKPLYKCKCDCGNSHVAKGACLNSGKTRSCGCGQLEAVTTHGLSYTREYYKAATYKRRARIKRNGTGRGAAFTAADLKDLKKKQNNLCFYCKKKLKQYHVDHKIPISRKGAHTKANICLACPKCNLTKHTKTAEEFQRKQQ